jgi:TRAP-type mannitol/chloroaromatic compound transport system permease small subunit
MAQPPPAMLKTIKVIDAFSERSGKLFAWMMVPLFLGLTYEVVARYVFNSPTEWAFDVTYMLYGSHFMLGAGYTLLKGGHIRTDMFYEKFSPRAKGLVDAIGYLVFFLPAVLFLLIAGWDTALRSWQILEKSEISPWRPPIYPFKTVVPLTALLLLVQGVAEFLKSLYAVKTGTLYAETKAIEI